MDGSHADHAGHAEHFRRLFWVSLWLAVPVVATSPMVAEWLGYTLPDVPGIDWVGPVLGTVLFLYGGRVFLTGGWAELRAGRPGMMALISLAITVAFVASWVSWFGVLDLEFWWELAALIVVMLLGHWQEMKAVGSARSALDTLTELLPDTAERVVGDGTEDGPVADLVAGDVVLVRPGSRVPADGVIVAGEAEFDESMLTGESAPVEHGPGDRLVAGSVTAGSSVRVRVDAIGEDTTLAGIRRMVAEAQQSRSRTQVLADRAAALLFWFATAAAAVTAVTWVLLDRPGDAVTRSVTVLVIACPHALGLAIPLVVALSTSLSARRGILVRDRLALERMRQVDTVLFDKTGTLTAGEHAVTDVAATAGQDPTEVLAAAAAVELDSEHPLARAIVARARATPVPVPTAAGFTSHAGRGVVGTVDGREVAVGGPALLRERSLTVPDDLAGRTAAWRARGAAVLHVVRDGAVVGALALEDRIREESYAAVRRLQQDGVAVVMITGDARQVAQHVAAELGIDEVRAEVLPEDKELEVRRLQERGRVVAMVGDGVNDAPALARADVGLAIGAGTDVAAASAHVVLASDDPRTVPVVRRLSRASYRKMMQNLLWASGYNLLAVPLAAGALAWAGVTMPPAVGALLMSASTIVVAANAQLLRRVPLGLAGDGEEGAHPSGSGPRPVAVS